MKKFVLLCACIMCMTVTVQAKTVRTATEEALEFFKIQQSENSAAIRKCRNYASIAEDDVLLAQTALDAGILVLKNGVLNMDSEDLTPIINGITSYGIKSGEYKVVTAVYQNGEIDKAPVTDETFLLSPIASGNEYTALIKNNKCAAVFEPGDIKNPVLYKGRLYIADGNDICFDNVQRYSLGKWINVDTKGRLMIGQTVGFSVSADDINANYLDKTVYFYADATDETVKIYGMRW